MILIFFASRIPSLTELPLHNDEGLHLTRAVEVWNLHPFWEIGDGKIINHWAIALFYPQNAPVFAGRIATIFISTLGLAAAFNIGRGLAGNSGGALAASLWIVTPYIFFYERLAFSDSEAGALVVVAIAANLKLARSGAIRDAIITGFWLALAVLFKFTAAPYAFSIVLITLLLPQYPLRRRGVMLAVIALTGIAMFAVPLAYLILRREPLFEIALGWVGVGSSQIEGAGLSGNIARFATLMTTFGIPLWALLTMIGLALTGIFRRKTDIVLLAAAFIPFMLTITLGREVLPRHFAAALPILVALGGAGLGMALIRLPALPRRLMALVIAITLAIPFALLAIIAYDAPENLPLPAEIRAEHITDHSSGYGLRAAVLDLPNLVTGTDTVIIASMFPDSCRRANFEAARDYKMLCTAAPGIEAITQALAAHPVVYIVTDNAPLIGADIPMLASALGATAERIGEYPRPGETLENASVVLWKLSD
ncbi:MAG: glycosyltransferase family 39 protein [Anaerolineae bacterium]|nr:glycosyltransferase family 39 protein [Anaerolineae bacterium]